LSSVSWKAGNVKISAHAKSLAEATAKWDRLWSAFDSGLGLLKFWYPGHFATIVVDETTFLLPTAQDEPEVAKCKSSLFGMLRDRAVRSGHDDVNARFIFASSSAKMARKLGATIFIST
jgi:hypothetical protein